MHTSVQPVNKTTIHVHMSYLHRTRVELVDGTRVDDSSGSVGEASGCTIGDLLHPHVRFAGEHL